MIIQTTKQETKQERFERAQRHITETFDQWVRKDIKEKAIARMEAKNEQTPRKPK